MKDCCDHEKEAPAASAALRIAIAGNPNCGKTTLFNLLTGARQRTGNWPGVTVERKTGVYRDDEGEIEVVDLPGVYTLRPIPGMEEQSLDEKLARDAIVRDDFDVIVNIVDATNLERNFYLTAQILETGRPVVIALNMMDAARKAGLRVDAERLARELGVPVVPLTASRGEGVGELMRAVRRAASEDLRPKARVTYPAAVERLAEDLEKVIDYTARTEHLNRRWLAIRLIEGDDLALGLAGEETAGVLRHRVPKLERGLGEEADMIIAGGRYAFAHDLARRAVSRAGVAGPTTSDRIDRLVLHWLAGPPIFLAAIYLMFMLTINLGGAFIDFFDILGGALFADAPRAILRSLGAPDWLGVILADGFGAGIQIVGTFIPIIGMLFLVLSFLEDSGYMVRAAFLMDRLMRAIGLPGKSFVPLIVGFGCNVPSIMAARTLENRRDRILTVMMAPFMSCGARLTVYALFAAAFFPSGGQNVVFALYLIGILAAILTGLLMKKTLLRGEAAPFVMELPPYRLPRLGNMLLHTWSRLKGFIFGAGKIIVIVVAVLSALNSAGMDGSFGNQGTQKSVLSHIGRAIVPVFKPIGIREDNWPATVGIFTGVFAKEAVVGTLNSLYSTLDAAQRGAEEKGPAPFDFLAEARRALASIPANLRGLASAISDPLGLSSATGSAEAVTADQGVSQATFGAMTRRFDGRAGAFAYMLFILLYFPCVAAFSAMMREIGMKWALFAGGWSTWLAWFASVAFYQAATFARHPAASLLWMAALAVAMSAFVLALRIWSGAHAPAPPAPAQ